MGLVEGTNCGFVTTAPTVDPEGEFNPTLGRFGSARNIKFVSPSGAGKITEMGWYVGLSEGDTNGELGIYSHDGDNNKADVLIGSGTTTTGGTVGWKTTSVNINIDENTTYWLAAQADSIDDSKRNTIDIEIAGGNGTSHDTSGLTSLPEPWVNINPNNWLLSIYAVWEEAPAGFTRKIKISGTFQDKPIKEKKAGTFEDKPISIKVGGTFQDA